MFKKASVALAGVLFFGSMPASAAELTGSLAQMVSRWETGDPNLSQLVSLHLASRAGDPVVVMRLADGVTASQVLPELSAAGFRLTSTSQLDARFLEGYLALGSARAAARVPGVAGVRA